MHLVLDISELDLPTLEEMGPLSDAVVKADGVLRHSRAQPSTDGDTSKTRQTHTEQP